MHFDAGKLHSVLRSRALLQHRSQAGRPRSCLHVPERLHLIHRLVGAYDPELHHARVDQLLQKRVVSHASGCGAQPFRA
jgi:hypothetical protein